MDNSTSPGSGAKCGCLFPEDWVLSKASSEVQSYRKLKGEYFFFFLGTVWLEPSDLLWHVSALVFNPCAFPGAWPDKGCCSGPGCVSCLSAYSNWRTAPWKMLELTAFRLWRKGEMRHFAVNPFKRSFRVMVSPFVFGSPESHICLFISNILLCSAFAFFQWCLLFSDRWNDSDNMGLIYTDTCNQS